MKDAYINGKIIDGTKEMQVKKGYAILVEQGKIKNIVLQEEADLTGYNVVNLKGNYIMPGLINMHVHLAGNGKPQKKQRDNAKLVNFLMSNPLTRAIAHNMVSGFAEMELLSGVTTIRTVGGIRDFDTRVRDEINCGKKRGPRILAGNEGISVPHGHMAGSVAFAAETMNTGRVLDAKEKGVPGELKMAPEMVKAVCDKAHELGFKVAAHVESSDGVRVALENGVDSIEHGAKLDDHMIKLFKENHAFLCTTLSPALPYALFDRSITDASEVEQFNGKVVFDGIIECAKQALENDIPIVLGNDVGCPWIIQYDFWRELYYFHKYVGVSNAYAIYCATLQAARMADIDDETGSIEVGKSADMIATKDYPLDDLLASRHIESVIMRGHRIDHPTNKINEQVKTELDKFL